MVTAFALCLLQTSDNALVKLADRIDRLKSVAFNYQRDLNYGSNGFKHTLAVRMYVEFDKSWQPLGARYQAKSPTFTEIFDGIVYLCRADSHEPVNIIGPDAKYFESVSVLKNSLIGLGNALRAAGKEAKSLKATGDAISFELNEKALASVKPLSNVGYTPRYEITVDSKSGLPVKIVHYLKDRKDTITTKFSGYDLSPKAATWEGSGN